MQLRQVKYFLALAEERHFSRAARRCRITQPSLSNAIRELEREFGAALFLRRPDIQLTALGSAIHPSLREIERLITTTLEVCSAATASRHPSTGLAQHGHQEG